MTAFIEEYKADFRTPAPFLLWVVLSLAVSIAGPFGSYGDISLVARLAYCSVLVAAAIIVGAAVRAFVHGTLGLRDIRRGSLLIAVLLCVLFTPPLFLINSLLFSNRLSVIPSFLELGGFVLFMSLGVGTWRQGVRDGGNLMPSEPGEAGTTSRLLQRIRLEERGQLIRIAGKDHYIELVTCQGIVRLRMRLSDAITEVEPVKGLQIHRSHWVALDAVTGAEKVDGKQFLILSDGARVPVSRNFRADAEAHGLL